MTLTTGSKPDFCEILSPLGAGGPGKIWLGENTIHKRKLAPKVLPADCTPAWFGIAVHSCHSPYIRKGMAGQTNSSWAYDLAAVV